MRRFEFEINACHIREMPKVRSSDPATAMMWLWLWFAAAASSAAFFRVSSRLLSRCSVSLKSISWIVRALSTPAEVVFLRCARGGRR